jgi:hypothetical protein
MPGNLYVSSTTDSQEAVDAAADYGGDVERQTEEEKPEQLELPEVEETETVAAQEPALPESEEGEEEEPQEEEEPEEVSPPEAAQVEGESKRQLRAQNKRLLVRDREKDQEIAELRRQLTERAPKPPVETTLKEPKQTDLAYFENGQFNFERFADDRTRWFNQQEKLATEQKAQDELNARIQAGIQQRVSRLMDGFKTQYPDAKFIGQGMRPGTGEMATDIISRMKTGSAEVLDYLYRTPEVRSRIEDLYDPADLPGSRDEMRDLLADLQSQLLESKSPSNGSSSSPARSPRPRATPPAPIRPVGGAAAVTNPSGNWYREDMPQSEFKRMRNAGYDIGGRR